MKICLHFALAIDGLCMCSINATYSLAKPDGHMFCIGIFTVLIEHCSMRNYQLITFKTWDKNIELQIDFSLP